jgi:phosphocarrier protein
MMNMQQTFRIIDEDGIHARPATALVNTANKFQDTNSFAESNGKKVTLKSILGVLSLGLEQGDTLTLITEGGNESEALQALQEVMINEGLGELHE